MDDRYFNRIESVAGQLAKRQTFAAMIHENYEGEPIPSSEELRQIVDSIRALLFPGFFGNLWGQNLLSYTREILRDLPKKLSAQLLGGLCFSPHRASDFSLLEKRAEELTILFLERLPDLRRQLLHDIEATYNGDPAATSYGEIIMCYPAVRAISSYRIAHELHKLEIPVVPRIITELAHFETGIDIHPEAQIGSHFTIDHGTGVVIGATTIIGNHVQLYQGVTLGAKSFPLDETGNPIKGIPRHPMIEDRVIIYSNATILGRITIGEGAVVGGNVWVTKDVPKGAVVVAPPTPQPPLNPPKGGLPYGELHSKFS